MMKPQTLFITVLLLIAGCDTTNNASVVNVDELSNSRWFLDRAETSEGNVAQSAEDPERAAIEFGSRSTNPIGYEVSGYNGCNLFSGIYQTTESGSLSFFSISQTYKACTENEGRLENAFMNGIEGAARFRRDGNDLVIEAPSRNVNLVFVRSTR